MRVGEVIGHVTLSRRLENIAGGRFLIVQPLSAAAIREGATPGSDPLVVYDELGAGTGSRVAFTEGREAAMPFLPRLVPADAYCAAVLDRVELGRGDE